MEGHRAWVALNLEHLRHNVAALQALLPPGCRLMPVVKANAYGHGAVPIARALSRLGIRSFCVATAEEGAELRRHHIPGDILILGFTPHSRFPNMMEAAGIPLQEVITRAIEEAVVL